MIDIYEVLKWKYLYYSKIQTIMERETNYNSIVIVSKRIIAKEES